MKRWLALLVVCTIHATYAQETITKDIDAFSELKVFDGIAVELVPAEQNRVVVTGANANEVIVKNTNGKLKIRMNINKMFTSHETFAKIYYNGMLAVLDVNENGFISAAEPIKQIDLELRSQEAGEIDIELDLQRLKVKSVTGGTIEVKGSAKNQVVDVNTGGAYEAGNLETEQTEVTVNAGGYADIRASEYVDATVKAGGNINIYGKPKVIDRTTFLGGTIKEIK
ncbi:head GIN domain-containing protein [Robertkochia flava]|uniref:head GIN domain-containing protein n=1 Tax=Robertkochia flava TaxID=3447986 RepID=UPI001CC9D289|nr:head GIN domain-containing protein [Robertkochia marina]